MNLALAQMTSDLKIKIKRCSDPCMWYRFKVGEMVDVIRIDVDGVWAYEESPRYGKLLNLIKFEDVL